jgi:hypothetical protein
MLTPAENVLWLSKTIFSFMRTFSIAPSAFSILRLREKISSLSSRWTLHTESEQFLMVVSIFCESSEFSTFRVAFFFGLSCSPISDYSRFLRFLDWVLAITSVFGASPSETRDGDFRGCCVSGTSVLYMMSEERFFTSQKFDRLGREAAHYFCKVYDFRVQPRKIFELRLECVSFRSKLHNRNDSYVSLQD